MPEEIVLPRLSDTMQEGTIARWAKKEGDAIAVGDVLMEVETDKATLELTSYHAGTLAQVLIGDGGTAPVGTVIGIIALPSETVASVRLDHAPSASPVVAPAKPSSPQEPTSTHDVGHVPPASHVVSTGAASATGTPVMQTTDTPASAVKASPLARVLAEQAGIDLRTLVGTGSGPGGRIVRLDVERVSTIGRPLAVPPPVAAPIAEASLPAGPITTSQSVPVAAPFVDQPLSRMRQAIARGMGTAKPGIPHIYLTVEVEMDDALHLRRQVNDALASDPRTKVSVNDLVVKATSAALHAYPAVNAWFLDATPDAPARIRTFSGINIGIAVSLDEGLIVPVIHDVPSKSLGTIAREAKDLYDRVRAGKPGASDLQGATFTISNLGAYGTEEFAAVIASPQAGILAVGAALPRAVVREGQIVARTTMRMTLSADHRVVDGVYAAQFLREIKRLLEHPISLVI